MKAVNQKRMGLLVIIISIISMVLGSKPVNSQELPGPIPCGIKMYGSYEESDEKAEPAYNIESDDEHHSESADRIMNDSSGIGIEMSVDAEPALKPEPWMSNDYYWSGKLSKSLKNMRVELEPELQIADWMSDDEYWGLYKIEKALAEK